LVGWVAVGGGGGGEETRRPETQEIMQDNEAMETETTHTHTHTQLTGVLQSVVCSGTRYYM